MEKNDNGVELLPDFNLNSPYGSSKTPDQPVKIVENADVLTQLESPGIAGGFDADSTALESTVMEENTTIVSPGAPQIPQKPQIPSKSQVPPAPAPQPAADATVIVSNEPVANPTPPPAPPVAPAPVVNDGRPDNYQLAALVTTIFCLIFFIGGLVALSYSSKVDVLWTSGQQEQAREASRNARNWCLITIPIAVVLYTILLIAIL